ncbi:hypothetical protein PHYPO_G00196330 [Pangasianodon hypophthalmus]|uniref:Uncharacterized protein n=1 Tax=Pangasianodon hypophthalmus TaxID=310915 RepID=A0A5N5PIU2_PANHP|nr:hypothetical protein PHYPO_G00196330 [Pangasianodon hypophthalmus]
MSEEGEPRGPGNPVLPVCSCVTPPCVVRCVTVKCVRVARRGRCSALGCLWHGDGGSSVLSTCDRKTDILLNTVCRCLRGATQKQPVSGVMRSSWLLFLRDVFL